MNKPRRWNFEEVESPLLEILHMLPGSSPYQDIVEIGGVRDAAKLGIVVFQDNL